MNSETHLTTRQQWVALAAVILIALAVRAYRINWQSPWTDEVFTIYTSGLDLGPMKERIVHDFVHPPLHYYLLHHWMQMFGYGTLPARVLSLIFGLLSVPLLFLLGRLLFGVSAGLVAAFLLAISQIGVNHSQEARPYSLALFLVIASIYWFTRAVRERRAVFWWSYVAITIVMLYSHYYTAFIVMAQVIFALLYRRSHPTPLRWWVMGALLGLAAYVPWLSSGILEEIATSSKVAWVDASKDPMTVQWYTPVSSLNWFHNGKWNGLYQRSPLWTYPAGCLLLGIPVLLALAPYLRRDGKAGVAGAPRSTMVMLLLLFLLPVALTIFMSYFGGVQFDVRYIVFTIAPYYLLVGAGITRIRPVAVRAGLLLVILVYSLGALRANYFVPYKTDFRGAKAYLLAQYRDGDCCVLSTRRSDRRFPNYWYVVQPGQLEVNTRTPEEVLAGDHGCERIWFIWDRQWWRTDLDHYAGVRDRLAEVHTLKHTERFYGVTVFLYEPK